MIENKHMKCTFSDVHAHTRTHTHVGMDVMLVLDQTMVDMHRANVKYINCDAFILNLKMHYG